MAMANIAEQVEVLMSGTGYGDDQTRENMAKELHQRLETCQQEGRPLRVYCGYDPRTADLHLGHTITMRKLRQFQDFGHDVTFLIGSFTSLIGDPSDKQEAREQLTPQTVDENARTYEEQAFKILDPGKTRVRRNDEWLSTLDFADIIKLAQHFTVQQFLSRDNFKKRIDEHTPIHLHECFYALMQAYDAVAQEADAQVGGQDQLFNILDAGRKLQSAMRQKPQIAIIMGESLPGTDGDIKMSKSKGNHIPLLSEPWDMYGKVMSLPDKVMGIYRKLLFAWSEAQVAELERGLREGDLHPNESKMTLAKDIVSTFHGADAAQVAETRWNEVFRGGSGVPEHVEEAAVTDSEEIRDILLRLDMVDSRGAAKRLIQQGGVRFKGEKVSGLQAVAAADMLPAILQVGKRKFVRLVKAE